VAQDREVHALKGQGTEAEVQGLSRLNRKSSFSTSPGKNE
jgi:hypothetical protein